MYIFMCLCALRRDRQTDRQKLLEMQVFRSSDHRVSSNLIINEKMNGFSN